VELFTDLIFRRSGQPRPEYATDTQWQLRVRSQ